MTPHLVLHHQIDQLKSDNLHMHRGAKGLRLQHRAAMHAMTSQSELSPAVELSSCLWVPWLAFSSFPPPILSSMRPSLAQGPWHRSSVGPEMVRGDKKVILFDCLPPSCHGPVQIWKKEWKENKGKSVPCDNLKSEGKCRLVSVILV